MSCPVTSVRLDDDVRFVHGDVDILEGICIGLGKGRAYGPADGTIAVLVRQPAGLKVYRIWPSDVHFSRAFADQGKSI